MQKMTLWSAFAKLEDATMSSRDKPRWWQVEVSMGPLFLRLALFAFVCVFGCVVFNSLESPSAHLPYHLPRFSLCSLPVPCDNSEDKKRVHALETELEQAKTSSDQQMLLMKHVETCGKRVHALETELEQAKISLDEQMLLMKHVETCDKRVHALETELEQAKTSSDKQMMFQQAERSTPMAEKRIGAVQSGFAAGLRFLGCPHLAELVEDPAEQSESSDRAQIESSSSFRIQSSPAALRLGLNPVSSSPAFTSTTGFTGLLSLLGCPHLAALLQTESNDRAHIESSASVRIQSSPAALRLGLNPISSSSAFTATTGFTGLLSLLGCPHLAALLQSDSNDRAQIESLASARIQGSSAALRSDLNSTWNDLPYLGALQK